ncbi:gliding motility-associated-like protein [Winogradskyella eximia]|uniref:Gliding motility-associated-like protein n=1 Tax=Winogradskyella eximia TaxID=262006 RepID=A0A3D9H139_9FLAO|nr:T9SS type B sorting domain-containing protein [Winogradskyella eximia]RED42248.1 gliding motility-associated-like protein [Winogradskyella eximia]
MIFGYYYKIFFSTNKLAQILLCVCCIFLGTSHAQNESSNWYFGSNSGLTFNTSPPSALQDSQMSTGEGCASVSDFAGELLFYTDGRTIWNRNHSVMLNGTDLLADNSVSQATLIISKPNNLNVYYVFTMDKPVFLHNNLYYSEIDMTLDNGLGGVTEVKNVLIASDVTEMLTSHKSDSFEGHWVVAHEMSNNKYLTFRIDELGINTEPIISSSGSSAGGFGQLKISPQGNKIAATLYSVTDNINVSSFNANTGVISNSKTLDLGNRNSYGLEFSPNGSLLYVSSGFVATPYIAQFDLSAGTTNAIQDSKTVIHGNSPRATGSMQLGIDGKIYISAIQDSYLDVIDNPNALGIDCNYIESAINLGSNRGQYGLPQWVESIFSNEIITVETTCPETVVNFTLKHNNFDSVIWDFGDPSSGVNNVSSDFNPQHTYPSSGTYTASATMQANGGEFQYSKDIVVFTNPETTETVQLIQCDDNMDGYAAFNLTEANEIISEYNGSLIFTYYLNEEAAKYETFESQITEILNYTNNNPFNDIVYARIENTNGCYSIAEINLTLSSNQFPQANMLNYTTCDDDISDIDHTDGIATFDFSDATATIENLFLDQDVTVSYYTNELDASSENDNIYNINEHSNSLSPFIQNIWVRIDGTDNNNCIGYGHLITLTVIPSNIDETDILDEYVICYDTDENIINTDLTIHTEISADNYKFQWYNGSMDDVVNNSSSTILVGAENNYYTPMHHGFYTVQITDINTGCNFWDSTHVIASYPPENINIEQTSPFFSTKNSVIVNAIGSGNYLYKLDSGEWQSSNIFSNIPPGEHIISVKDVFGCDVIEKSFSLVGFPVFFTPNDDGINDFWMVNSSENLVIKKILIFNRYGKLITELKGTNSWDGTYNGNLLPTNDYWFSMTYFNTEDFIEKKFLGHFTLKR